MTSFLKKQRQVKMKTHQTNLKSLESEHKESTEPKITIEIKKEEKSDRRVILPRDSKEMVIYKTKLLRRGQQILKTISIQSKKATS